MQHYLSTAHVVRPHSHALVCLLSDPTTCSRRLSRNVEAISEISLRYSEFSSPCSQAARRLFPFRSTRRGLPRPGCVRIAVAHDESAVDNSSRKNLPTDKVIRIALCTAIVVGAAVLAKTGSAYANSQIALPKPGQSPAVATSGRDLLISAWMGLMAGCLHTLTGPDHLAALAPLSIGRTRLQSVAVGALWGCGHDAGQVIFGILFLLLKDRLHIEVIRTWGARVVGMTLVAIGIVGMKEAQEGSMVPCLAGSSSGLLPPNMSSPMEPVTSRRRNISLATFATGIVHGLQPDALIMILPALALPSRFAGAAFLIMFLLGTILSMSGYTAFIGSCSTALQKRIPKVTEHLARGSSLVAILVGIGILGSELFGISIF